MSCDAHVPQQRACAGRTPHLIHEVLGRQAGRQAGENRREGEVVTTLRGVEYNIYIYRVEYNIYIYMHTQGFWRLVKKQPLPVMYIN